MHPNTEKERKATAHDSGDSPEIWIYWCTRVGLRRIERWGQLR